MDAFVALGLIAKTETRTGMGVRQTVDGTARTVYGQLGSVSAKENFDGVVAGFKPSCKVTLKDARDYAGEDECIMDDQHYEIYRTYLLKDGGIELYLQRRAGVIGR